MTRNAMPFVLAAALTSFLATADRAEAQVHFSADVDVDFDFSFGAHVGAHGHGPRRGRVVVEEAHPHPPIATPTPAPPADHPTVLVVPAPQPPPQVVVVTPTPTPTPPPTPPAPRVQPTGAYPPPNPVFRPHRDLARSNRWRSFGVRGALLAAGGGGAAMAGSSGAIRFRPAPRYALDVGVAAFHGTDWANRDRIEGSLFVDGRLYLNPSNNVQLYGLGGLALSRAALYSTEPGGTDRTLAHLSGSLGAGLELRIAPFLSIDLEARALLRSKVADSESDPEFVERVTYPDGSSQERGTDLSAAGVLSLGATLYF